MSNADLEISSKKSPISRTNKKNVIIGLIVAIVLVVVIIVVVIFMNVASRGKGTLASQGEDNLQNDGRVSDNGVKGVLRPSEKKRSIQVNNAPVSGSTEDGLNAPDSVVIKDKTSKVNNNAPEKKKNSQEELTNKLRENALDAKNKALEERSSEEVPKIKDAVVDLKTSTSTTDLSVKLDNHEPEKKESSQDPEKKGISQDPKTPQKEDVGDTNLSEEEFDKEEPKPEDIELNEIIAYLSDVALPHDPVICQKIWKRLNEVLELKDGKGSQIYTLDFVKKRCLQTLPDDIADAFIALQQMLSSSGDWDLGDIENKFAVLRAHNGIEELYPEFAASSVYETYFEKFTGKVDTLIKAKGIANADKATAIIKKLAQKSKTKLDELITSMCAQENPSSDLCFHMRKGSLIQDLDDAFANYDSVKFKSQWDELGKHRQTSLTFDESSFGININSLFNMTGWNSWSFVKYRFEYDFKVQDHIDALKDDDMSTQIRKYDQLAQICKALFSRSTIDISTIRDNLVMNFIDPHIINFIEPVMGTADLASLLNPIISDLHLDSI